MFDNQRGGHVPRRLPSETVRDHQRETVVSQCPDQHTIFIVFGDVSPMGSGNEIQGACLVRCDVFEISQLHTDTGFFRFVAEIFEQFRQQGAL